MPRPVEVRLEDWNKQRGFGLRAVGTAHFKHQILRKEGQPMQLNTSDCKPRQTVTAVDGLAQPGAFARIPSLESITHR